MRALISESYTRQELRYIYLPNCKPKTQNYLSRLDVARKFCWVSTLSKGAHIVLDLPPVPQPPHSVCQALFQILPSLSPQFQLPSALLSSFLSSSSFFFTSLLSSVFREAVPARSSRQVQRGRLGGRPMGALSYTSMPQWRVAPQRCWLAFYLPGESEKECLLLSCAAARCASVCCSLLLTQQVDERTMIRR